MKTSPNIFTYATSELSQDAFILWLIDWANPDNACKDKSLCETAQSFVRLLLNKSDLSIISVACKKQEHYIDVFAIVNNHYALIVEDKTNTSEHNNQINRYLEWVKKHNNYSKLELHCVYYKIGNESKYKLNCLNSKFVSDFSEYTFRIIGKEEVLNLLLETTSKNAILLDYIERLKVLHEVTIAFSKVPYKKWEWETWQGFYMDLEDKLGRGDWGYVANPAGGFLGYWWHWCPLTSDPTIELYLQIEQDKLCIKAYSKAETRPLFSWTDKIKTLAKAQGLSVESPNRRRVGKTMTLAVVNLDYLFDIPLDINATIEKLKTMEKFVSAASRQI